jgi:hypothetical protein
LYVRTGHADAVALLEPAGQKWPRAHTPLTLAAPPKQNLPIGHAVQFDEACAPRYGW